jgi:hypothetical protein
MNIFLGRKEYAGKIKIPADRDFFVLLKNVLKKVFKFLKAKRWQDWKKSAGTKRIGLAHV